MTARHVIVFRSRLREGVMPEYNELGGAMYALVERMPGFVAANDFVAEDGERLALIEFDGAAELAAWRELPEHRAAQARGRERFYARYALQVCAELRASEFDAAAGTWVQRGRDPAALVAIGARWLDCFARRDLDGLLALYADDARHTSPKIRARHPETGGALRGKPALRAWWADAFARLPSMRYQDAVLTADGDRVFMEYVRRVDGEPDLPVAEALDVQDGVIVASRVYHG
jgi:heme-degrading monooxygenase HmoA/ketosteroid isomerase-like protein